MSDIPVGSPPVPPGRHAAPSGWYPDPVNPANERYWDGWQWSRNTREVETPGGKAPQAAYAGYPGQPGYGQVPYGTPPTPYGGYPPAAYAPAQRPVPRTADGVPLAGWWWRVLAMLVDGLIVAAVAAAFAFPIYARMIAVLRDYLTEGFRAAQAGLPPPPQPPVSELLPPTDQMILLLIAIAVEMIYILTFLRWKAATPGKLVCGLRVVPVDRGLNTAPLGWSTIVVRAAVWVLPGAISILLPLRLVDALFPLWQPKRQALHDLAAKTQVIKRP